ncbi:MAG TPA: chromate resistance protein ChrB domain-containing protein [Burkholderiales bacterium]|nr:chromate resistance protein ChrB domain-containing protein [Burkholderiales bacterium]
MDAPISRFDLHAAVASDRAPLVIDVRREAAFRAAPTMIAGALRRDPESVARWAPELPVASSVVVYCVHGHEVSQNAAAELVKLGIRARYLEGGFAAWAESDFPLARKPVGGATRWVTRERPKVDRIACPWLVQRFIDPTAEFLYVPPKEVLEAAKRMDAVPYDIPDVAFSHDGELCSFDAFLKAYRLRDPALAQLAVIVRGADTARLDLAPQAAGLAALSLGLSRRFVDDHEMLRHGMVMYDALYLWCKQGQEEVHTWNPAAYR